MWPAFHVTSTKRGKGKLCISAKQTLPKWLVSEVLQIMDFRSRNGSDVCVELRFPITLTPVNVVVPSASTGPYTRHSEGESRPRKIVTCDSDLEPLQ